nr:MAG TPA: hypothetical protein [Bacteriophage sp.]
MYKGLLTYLKLYIKAKLLHTLNYESFDCYH